MASIVVSGDSSGTITLSAPSVAGSNTATLPASTGTVALTSDVIGLSQTWTDVTASRASGTTYTNSTGKPIQVFIQINLASNSIATFAINGITFSIGANSGVGTTTTTLSFIVPNGNTYIFTGTISKWAELR